MPRGGKYSPVKNPWNEAEYNEHETVCLKHFALVWGGANLLGLLAHGAAIVYAATSARLELTMETADVKPQLCNPDAATSLDNLIGVLAVEGQGRASGFSLGWVIIAFHALSACFHLVAATALLLHASGAWVGNPLYELYRYGLYWNLAFWRWLEYVFSASLMMLILGSMLGVREIRSLQAQVGAMATVILFGWITDLISSPFIVDEVYKINETFGFARRWKEGSWLVRWQVHLYGYIPYALVWVLVFRGYDNATSAFGPWLPPASHQLVIGTFVVFTVFGLVQLILQLLPFGPSLYAWGELVYIVLSFAAKANLGILAISQALVPGAEYDALLFHQFNESLLTCQDYATLAPEELVP